MIEIASKAAEGQTTTLGFLVGISLRLGEGLAKAAGGQTTTSGLLARIAFRLGQSL